MVVVAHAEEVASHDAGAAAAAAEIEVDALTQAEPGCLVLGQAL